ncbi:MAG: hypothetical protein BYD32DRAFT_465440 [Podila humilis]|nr:MAG: hypothetical protein BYD32DRAFT_465440 [Podila humilis]
MEGHFKYLHVNSIREKMIKWGVVYQTWTQSLYAPSYAAPKATQGPTIEGIRKLRNVSCRGLRRLEVSFENTHRSQFWIRSRFERGCQDLVGIPASVGSEELKQLMPLFQLCKHTVQQVDILCAAYLGDHTAFELLSQILGSLIALKHLRFVAEGGLTKEESFAVFRAKLGQQADDQGDGAALEMAATAEDKSPVWACQGLESLVINGM